MTVDGWTLLHILTGTALALLRVPRSTAYTIILGTELLEMGFRSRGITFFRETPGNVLVDILASGAGYELTKAVLK